MTTATESNEAPASAGTESKQTASVIIGADHGGFELKEAVVNHLRAEGHDVEDIGTSSCDSVDYPEYAHRVACDVESGKHDFGILCCTSGVGMSIAANKHQNIRAAIADDVDTAKVTRIHNNSNVLCLSGARVSGETAAAIADIFLSTSFEDGGRHERRVEQLNAPGCGGGGKSLAAVDIYRDLCAFSAVCV